MFNIRFEGLKLIPSRSAVEELVKYGLMIEDCKDILENGYEPKKRSKGTIEKWLNKRNKTYNVVVIRSYNFLYGEEVYLIKHIGKFTKKKLRGMEK